MLDLSFQSTLFNPPLQKKKTPSLPLWFIGKILSPDTSPMIFKFLKYLSDSIHLQFDKDSLFILE